MRKELTTNSRFAGGIFRGLAAASLACSLALFGCTTDRMPGNGKPDMMGPGVGPAPASETPGSESGNVPMTSSYTHAELLQSVQPRSVDTDALAIAAADQGFRGRTLAAVPSDFGPNVSTAAGTATVAGAEFPTGQFINPSTFANPAQTLNSSISSSGPFVNTGIGTTAGDMAFGVDQINTGTVNAGVASTGATTGALTTTNGTTTTGTTQPATALVVTPTGVVSTTTLPSTVATPTNTALPITVGQFAAGPGVQTVAVPSTLNPGSVVITNLPTGTLTPTVSSGAMISPTRAANPVVITGARTTTSTGAVATTTAPVVVTTGSVTGPLVMQRSASGTITISNITTTPGLSIGTVTSTPTAKPHAAGR